MYNNGQAIEDTVVAVKIDGIKVRITMVRIARVITIVVIRTRIKGTIITLATIVTMVIIVPMAVEPCRETTHPTLVTIVGRQGTLSVIAPIYRETRSCR